MLDWQLFGDDSALKELGVRIIAADRPGYGLSDRKRGRALLDWPDDIVELADELQVSRFAVLGISGGGPYAAACAYKIGDRLTKVGVACGMGPSDSPGMKDGVSWTIPGQGAITRRIVLLLTSLGVRKDPDKFMSQSRETFSKPDKLLLEDLELSKLFVEGFTEAFRTGVGGATQEAALYPRPWGFELQDIAADVYLWHGDQDLNVPVSVGRYVADAIPNCTAKFHKGEGHLTLPRNHLREILGALVG
jgi:pimeloyl-ACP methyl ester carboxylesterase